MTNTSKHRNNIATKSGVAALSGIADFTVSRKGMQWQETLSDGSLVLIRPIEDADGPLERNFIERLSPESREYRFLGQVTISDDLVRRMTQIDFDRDLALVAIRTDDTGSEEIGVSRFCLADDNQSCECAVVVSDEWQGKGLGTVLMAHLIDIARRRGIKRMVSIDLATNVAMRNLAHSLGFQRQIDEDYPYEVMHTLKLA